MKIKLYGLKLNSTLSCILKSISFFAMIHKKFFLGLFFLGFLSACGAPTAMIGPVYTFTSTGNMAHAGLTYGSSELVINYTGKTPIENLGEITSNNLTKKNIQKQTLESEDFHQLVKKKFEKTRGKIKLSNQ